MAIQWFKLAPPQIVFNAPNVKPFKMTHARVIPWDWSVDQMFDQALPMGARHLIFNCHGFPTKPDFQTPHLSIGTVIHPGNISAFQKLFGMLDLWVIWISSCNIAGSEDGLNFCKDMAKISGCYVVAYGFPVPDEVNKQSQLKDYTNSMPKYIEPSRNLMRRDDFLKLGPKLGFELV